MLRRRPVAGGHDRGAAPGGLILFLSATAPSLMALAALPAPPKVTTLVPFAKSLPPLQIVSHDDTTDSPKVFMWSA